MNPIIKSKAWANFYHKFRTIFYGDLAGLLKIKKLLIHLPVIKIC